MKLKISKNYCLRLMVLTSFSTMLLSCMGVRSQNEPVKQIAEDNRPVAQDAVNPEPQSNQSNACNKEVITSWNNFIANVVRVSTVVETSYFFCADVNDAIVAGESFLAHHGTTVLCSATSNSTGKEVKISSGSVQQSLALLNEEKKNNCLDEVWL